MSALEPLQFGAALVGPWLWTVCALTYTGRGAGITRERLALLAGVALPVVVGAAIVAGSPSEADLTPRLAPLAGWLVLYLPALFLYGTYRLAELGGTHTRVSHTQVATSTIGTATPYLASSLDAARLNVTNATAGLLISGSLLFVAVRRYPVLTGSPEADYVARTRVVESLHEALVVLDWHDYVLDVNEATVELFGCPANTMIAEPIRSTIDGLEKTDLSTGATRTVRFERRKAPVSSSSASPRSAKPRQ